MAKNREMQSLPGYQPLLGFCRWKEKAVTRLDLIEGAASQAGAGCVETESIHFQPSRNISLPLLLNQSRGRRSLAPDAIVSHQ